MWGHGGDRLNLWDALAFALLAALGATLGTLLARQMGSVFLYQNFTPEALMWACGQGWRHPLELPEAAARFLWQRNLPAFDCSVLADDPTTGPTGFFFRTQPYLSGAAALLWRWLGTTQQALIPLASLLAAAQAAAGYAVARLFLPRPWAALAGAVLAVSPVALGQLFLLRDFSKGPFVLWTLVLLVLAARADALPRALALAAAAGAVAALGFGVRADLGLFLVLGPVFLLAAGRLRWRGRLPVAGANLATYLALAAPILALGNAGNVGSLVMQGATEPFRAFLALRPAPYALGHAYLDELTLSGIAAAERPRRPGWDEREPAPVYGFSQAMSVSTANLLEWAPAFPADFAAQALKGTAWLLGYPALVAVSRGAAADPGFPLRLQLPVVRWQEPLWSFFARPWMPAFGLLGALALLLRLAARSPREAWCLAALFLFLAGTTAVQFSVRHVFHLEFLWVVGLLSLPAAALELRRLAPVAPRFALSAAAALGAMALAYAGLAAWQQRQLVAQLSALLALPRESVATFREPAEGGGTLLRAAVPPQHQAVVAGRPDSMTEELPLVGVQHSVVAGGDRMLLRLGGASCPAAPAELRLAYDKRPRAWQPLDQTLTAAPGEWLVFPALHRATQNFAGVVLPPSHEGCEVELFRLPLTHGLPFVFTARLAEGWEDRPLRKGLGRFGVGPAQ